MTTLEKLMFLKSVDLFRSFGVEDLHLIAQIAREEPLPETGDLFRAGEPAGRLWVLVNGNVSLYTERDGLFHLLAMLGEGDCCGEVALLDGGAHATSARIDGSGTALVIERDDTLALIKEVPTLAVAFLEQLAGQVRRLQERIQLLEEAMQQK